MKSLYQTALGATGPYFLWEVPAEQIVVLLHFNVVQLLAGATARAGNASAAGVLLGRSENGKQLKLIVEGYEAATPELGAPESPFKDQELAASLLERLRLRQGRMSILGFYRTCGREGAALSRDDLRTVARSTDTSSHSDCNLSRQQEVLDEPTETLGDGAVATEAAIKTNSPNQDLERIFLMIEPRGARGANASFYLIRNSTVLCQSSRIPFNRMELSRIGCLCQGPGSSIQDISSQDFQLDFEPSSQLAPRPVVNIENTEKTTNRWWPIAAVVLIGILGVSVFQMSGGQIVNPSSRHTEIQNAGQIGLQVERKGADWEITWDHTSSALRQAKMAHLLIKDALIRKDIELSSSDLRHGRVLYSPTSDDLVVTMEAESGDSSNTPTETVHLVAGLLPTPALAEARELDRSRDRGRNAVPQNKRSGMRSYFTQKDDANSKPADSRPLSANGHKGLENITALKTPMEPLWELPGQPDFSALVPSALPGESLGVPAKQPELPLVRQELFPIRGNDVQAELISRTNPIYPGEAKSRKVEGNVEVQFTISREGAVKDLSVIKGDPVLAQATMQAVQGWRYKPAQENGSPTEAQGKVVVNFKLD